MPLRGEKLLWRYIYYYVNIFHRNIFFHYTVSHGELYVAFSKAQDPENVKAFTIPIENKQGPMPSPLNNTYTSNVVYTSVLI